MGYFRRKIGFLSFVLLSSAVFSACSNASSVNVSEEAAVSQGAGDLAEAELNAEDDVNSAVNFNLELDQYEPKKDHYNFYFSVCF